MTAALCSTCHADCIGTARAALDVLDDFTADPTERKIAAGELVDAARWLRLPVVTASKDAS